MDRGPGTTAALAVAGGAVFGATTSLVNALSSPYGQLALTDGPLRRLAVVASLLLDAGWAWAALAVAGGWLAGGVRRGALAGSLALLGAVPAYYLTDAAGRGEELSGYVAELLFWAVAALLLGSALGAVGGLARRRDLLGLVGRLVVPLGAAAQAVLLPPGFGRPMGDGEARTAQLLVLGTAVLAAGALCLRHQQQRDARRAEPTGVHGGGV